MPIYWPGIAIGVIVAAYWGRVLRLVYKTWKRTGRAANFFPRETLGRILRILWYPAVLGWIIIPFVIGWRGFASGLFKPFLIGQVASWVAVVVALGALLATLVCWKRMGKSWRMGIDPGEKTQLIVSGPYAYVRHPIYGIQQILMLASVIAVPVPAMVIIAALLLLFLQWEARREERYLVQSHGAAYELYMQNVGRFFPKSLARYAPAAG